MSQAEEITRKNLIEEIKKVKSIVGRTPSISDYDEHADLASSTTIKRRFGSWNKAKEKAGLEKCNRGYDRSKENTQRGVYRKKLNGSCCLRCGEESNCALTFHHTNPQNKKEVISEMRHKSEYGVDDIKEEIEKCVVICQNCHAKHHSSDHEFCVGDEL
jgi:hypothetical protein